MLEVIFLFVLALVWIAFATIQDLKTREIANWLNFSLIVFALAFRFFYSLFNAGGFGFFYQGLFGLGVFFALGNILYYGRMFAGGDAKLLIALGAVLPVSESFSANLEGFLFFLAIFLLAGAFYSIAVSAWFCFKNFGKFRKEFRHRFKINRKMFILSLLFSIALLILSYASFYLIFIAVLVFIIPYLYLYAKSVDETAMVKTLDSKKLREGDWLYKDVKVGNRTIKANWGGLTKEEIFLLRKNHKKTKIREGVAFTPVFLISFLVFFYLLYKGSSFLGYSFW